MTDEYQFFLQKIADWLQADLGKVVFSQSVPAYNNPATDPQKLVFIESGAPVINIGCGDKVEPRSLPAGTVIHGASGAPTGLFSANNQPAQTLAICFFPDYIRLVEYKFGQSAGRSNVRFLHTPYSLQFGGKTMLELLEYAQRNSHMAGATPFLIKALLSLLSSLLAGCNDGKQGGKAAFTWRQVEAYISNHLDGDLSRRKLAGISKLNPNYLSSLCREKTGFTLNQYVRKQRLMRAAILLELEMTLDEIACACGFKYTGYFIRMFKLEYGISPGKYRCQHSLEWINAHNTNKL